MQVELRNLPIFSNLPDPAKIKNPMNVLNLIVFKFYFILKYFNTLFRTL